MPGTMIAFDPVNEVVMTIVVGNRSQKPMKESPLFPF
jgi:hypothetical protein